MGELRRRILEAWCLCPVHLLVLSQQQVIVVVGSGRVLCRPGVQDLLREAYILSIRTNLSLVPGVQVIAQGDLNQSVSRRQTLLGPVWS